MTFDLAKEIRKRSKLSSVVHMYNIKNIKLSETLVKFGLAYYENEDLTSKSIFLYLKKSIAVYLTKKFKYVNILYLIRYV